MTDHPCRFCGAPLTRSFADLGMSPPSNRYLKPGQEERMEPFYPLHAFVCEVCLLVQLEQFESPSAIFGDYAYFSSYSDLWLAHAREYVERMMERFHLGAQSKVVEIASNDGYLLRNFKQLGVPILGIEPAANVAAEAERLGIPTRVDFFGVRLARQLLAEGHSADLLLGNNVLAHVPELNDFVAGLKILLKAKGVITLEFPHLLRLIEFNQFDTIYHEHFSYFSFLTVRRVFEKHGLELFDVDELPTHGGSLRIYGRHVEDESRLISEGVRNLLESEREAGLEKLETYSAFEAQVKATKRKLLTFLISAKDQGKTIVGYGAPAKGNTLLNYCGIRQDFLDYTVDRSPHKQGQLLPGSHIRIFAPEHITETRPDYLLVLPWNIKDEIMSQMRVIKNWGGKFVIPIPEPTVIAP